LSAFITSDLTSSRHTGRWLVVGNMEETETNHGEKVVSYPVFQMMVADASRDKHKIATE
jgi:hypothetical protein